MYRIFFILTFLFILNSFLWSSIIIQDNNLAVYFLDVGQGDSELIKLPGKKPIYILIDGGPNGDVVSELNKIIPFGKKIDIVIATHADKDHSGGLAKTINSFGTNAFIYNGLSNNKSTWQDLNNLLQKEDIPIISLKRGDSIKYGDNIIEIISPTKDSYGTNNNTASLVTLLTSEDLNILFTGDIDDKVEQKLIKDNVLKDIDILKVAHHGSKYGSIEDFLKITKPEISIIEVGKNNYGHPTQETLNRLANINSQIFRTDEKGTIKIEKIKDKIIISAIK